MSTDSGTITRQTASHWGVSEVTTADDGEIIRVDPSALDPHPSPLHTALPAIVRSPLRISQPHVSSAYLAQGPGDAGRHRGASSFVPVAWDTALDLVAGELTRVKREFGNAAIYGGSYGWASAGRLHHAPSLLKRFLGLHGGFVDKLGNHSFGAALGIMPHVIGRSDIPRLVVPWPAIVEHGRLMVMFGGAHIKNTQIDSGGAVAHSGDIWFRRARDAGVHIINISPCRGDVVDHVGAEWWPIRPNTDLALMLGLAHTLEVEGRADRDFLDRYCVGYERFATYLRGDQDGIAKDAQWAAAITGIGADQIISLARRMAATRTMVATSWSIQRADHGEQPVWMTVVLAAMLAQIGLPGGGFSLGFGATSGISLPPPPGIPKPTMPLGVNPVETHVPVACVTDMLLNPGGSIDYNGRKLQLPDIKLVYSVGGNPFHHNTDLNRFLSGWQRPQTIIVHEPWWTPAARHADIVLPATTTMERNDILAADAERFYVAMHKVIEPVGEARNDFDIFAALAERLGFGAAYGEGRDEMGWLRHMYEEARQIAGTRGFDPPPFDDFWARGSCEFSQSGTAPALFEDFLRDPAAHALKTPSGRIEIYSETIARFGYDDCPPHPAWIEPAEWLGAPAAARYPLHLLSNQPSTRLHSQLDPSPLSLANKVAGREPIYLNRADATARGVRTGDVVRVFNDRGAFLAGAVVSDDLLPRVAQIATGAWFDPQHPGEPGALEKHGNPNVVTSSRGTSKLSQSSTAQTVLVEIEKFDGTAPLSAFDPPPIEADRHPAPPGDRLSGSASA